MAYDAIDYSKPLQFDASGRPYRLTHAGATSYLPPIQAMQEDDPRAQAWAASQGVTRANPSGGTGSQNTFGSQNNGWNPQTGEFDRGMNMGGLGGAILGGAALAGPLVVGPAIAGAAGGSASGGAFSDTAPAWGAGGSANAAALGGTAAGGSVPLGGITAGTGMVDGLTSGQIAGLHLGESAAGTSLAHDLVSHILTPGGIATLASAIPSLIRDAGGGANNDPTTQALLDMALKRQQRVDPLHASVTRLANAMLPTAYQNGGQ